MADLAFATESPSSPGRPSATSRRAYVVTFTVIGLTLVESFVGYRIVAARFGEAGFAQFTVALRVLAMLQPALLAGASVTLPRLLPRLVGKAAEPERRALVTASLGVVGSAALGVAGIFIVFSSPLASLIFNDRAATPVVRGFALLLIGSCIHGVAYAAERATLNELRANVLLFANFVAVPLVAVLFAPSAMAVLMVMGLSMTAASSLLLLRHLRGPAGLIRPAMMRLIRDGLPRVPGEFATFGILALPPVVAAHQIGLIRAGYFAFGVALLSAFGAGMAPISLVQLPRISAALGRRDFGDVLRHVRITVRVVLAGGIAMVAVAELLLPVGVKLYFGDAGSPSTSMLRLVVLALPAQATYMGLRGILDAYYDAPVNMKNGVVAFLAGLVATVVFLFVRGTWAPLAGVLTGTSVLGLLSLVVVGRIAKDLEQKSVGAV